MSILLKEHFEKEFYKKPFSEFIPSLLYHQYRTYNSLLENNLVINTYDTGTGKTKASLLYLFELNNKKKNVFFIAPTNELISQHVRDIEEFINLCNLNFYVIEVNAQILRNIGLSNRELKKENGVILLDLIENPLKFAVELGIDENIKKPLILVTNPDIFYLIIYFHYSYSRELNLFESVIKKFSYFIIDEFHYYTPKQLANFLFFFSILKEYGYFDIKTTKICLLSATPNEMIMEYFNKIGLKYELLSPDNESKDTECYKKIQILAPVLVDISNKKLDDYFNNEIIKELIEKEKNGLDGVVISNSLNTINKCRQAISYVDSKWETEKVGRITGPISREERQKAKYMPLILATPTVDIGYNFTRDKDRQPIDYVIFESHYYDDFIQRLGRTGRVLGKNITNIPSYAFSLSTEEFFILFKQLDGQTMSRRELFSKIKEKNILPVKNQISGYIENYSVIESLNPIFKLLHATTSDFEDKITQIFDKIVYVFTGKQNFSFKKAKVIYYAHIECGKVMKNEEKPEFKKAFYPNFLKDYYDGNEEQLREMWSSDKEMVNKEIKQYASEKYYWYENLLTFRNSSLTVEAYIYDPYHFISSDSTPEPFDLFHILSNYKYKLIDYDYYQTLTKRNILKNAIFIKLDSILEKSNYIAFELNLRNENITREVFEKRYVKTEPVCINNLEIIIKKGNSYINIDDKQLSEAFKKKYIHILILNEKHEAGFYKAIRNRKFNRKELIVKFNDCSEKIYQTITGHDAFEIYPLLKRYVNFKNKELEYFIV